ncbi:hypothetical protein V5799_006857 [Amblyomma americanum]|uniref:Uncharacterized protein n=1 Tax=Amblyomma americanum TaxID=6943 RepID=A0AAQ4DV71_AMBAM
MEAAPTTTCSGTQADNGLMGADEEEVMQQDAGDGESSLTQEELNWEVFHSKRRKKRKRRAGKNRAAPKAGDPVSGTNKGKMAPTNGSADGMTQPGDDKNIQKEETRRQPKQMLPPLPKDDAKIIIRPCGGLKVQDMKPYQATRAIVKACGGNIKEEDFPVRLQPG